MAKRPGPKTSPKTPAKAREVAPDNANTTPVMIRMEIELRDSLDAWAAKLNASGSGPTWTRTDVIRVCLQRALREREAKGEAP